MNEEAKTTLCLTSKKKSDDFILYLNKINKNFTNNKKKSF